MNINLEELLKNLYTVRPPDMDGENPDSYNAGWKAGAKSQYNIMLGVINSYFDIKRIGLDKK